MIQNGTIILLCLTPVVNAYFYVVFKGWGIIFFCPELSADTQGYFSEASLFPCSQG
jgi:hypothetical protein